MVSLHWQLASMRFSLRLECKICACRLLARLMLPLCAAGSKELLLEHNARVYVAELPPKYNVHTIAEEGCTESRHLEKLLSNPLGSLLGETLDTALYRCANAAVTRRPAFAQARPLGGAPVSFCLPVKISRSSTCAAAGRRNSSALNLEVHMHMQMLYSPLHVLTVEEADVVYALLIPNSSAVAMLACLSVPSVMASTITPRVLQLHTCAVFCAPVDSGLIKDATQVMAVVQEGGKCTCHTCVHALQAGAVV